MKARVSVVMPVRNERESIERALRSVLDQDYPAEFMQVIVVDGMSEDGTREVVAQLAEETAGRSSNIILLDNRELITPTALNRAIAVADGDVIVRVDGHCELEPDYVRRCVELLRETGADNVGGVQRAVATRVVPRTIALATTSPFGVGNATFRYSQRQKWVDTVFLGAYRRDVFERIGGFDEDLPNNQDDELNLRLTRAGGRILLDPSIRVRYQPRGSFRSLWRQYFRYGLYKVRVMQKAGGFTRSRHYVPAALVIGLVSGVIVAFASGRLWVASFAPLAYAFSSTVASVIVARRDPALFPLLPLAFATLHLSYGFGFLWGLWRWRSGGAKAASSRDDEVDRLRRVYRAYAEDERVAARWNPTLPGNVFIDAERWDVARDMLTRSGRWPVPAPVLEVGCGTGHVLARLTEGRILIPPAVGVDVLADRLSDASRRFPDRAWIRSDGRALPFPAGAFETVVVFTVFSSVLEATIGSELAREIDRILSPTGAVLWYDYRVRRPGNRNTKGMTRAAIGDLFPDLDVDLRSLTVVPPLARRLPRGAHRLYAVLAALPFLRSHYMGVFVKRAATRR